MLDINLTILIQMASFLVFMVLMNRVFFRPISEAIEARQSYLLEQQNAATHHVKEAEELQRDYEARLKATRQEAQAALAKAIDEAEARRREAIAQAQQEASGILNSARGAISAERDAALGKLESEVSAIAHAIVDKVLEAPAAQPSLAQRGATR